MKTRNGLKSGLGRSSRSSRGGGSSRSGLGRHALGDHALATASTAHAAALDGSAFARAAFGDRVIDHYVNSGRYEVQAFESAVTDWEMVRSFERS